MARRRIWRRKPAQEKERRRKIPTEKEAPVKSASLVFSEKFNGVNPEIDACYRGLSPMTREVVDHLVATGLSIEKVINGIRS